MLFATEENVAAKRVISLFLITVFASLITLFFIADMIIKFIFGVEYFLTVVVRGFAACDHLIMT